MKWWLQRLGDAFTCRRPAAAQRAQRQPAHATDQSQPAARCAAVSHTQGRESTAREGGQRHTLCTVPSTQLGGGAHTAAADAPLNVSRYQQQSPIMPGQACCVGALGRIRVSPMAGSGWPHPALSLAPRVQPPPPPPPMPPGGCREAIRPRLWHPGSNLFCSVALPPYATAAGRAPA